MNKELTAKYNITLTFKLNNRGLVLAGFITDGTISLSEYIEFTANDKLRSRRIIGIEGLNVAQPSPVNIGLIIKCENDDEITELRNWKPENTTALIYKIQ